MLSSQEESVLKTLAFFDIFSRPLKEEEIFDNLQQTTNDKRQKTDDQRLTTDNRQQTTPKESDKSDPTGQADNKISFLEFQKSLVGQNLQSFIGNEGDFYFLEGREE